MSHNHFTIEKRKGKHLTEKERYQIEILLKEKIHPTAIAKKLGRDRRTIEREISRGKVRLLNSDLTYREEYSADIAQDRYNKNNANKGPTLKIGHDHKLAKYIEKKIIQDKYSPDAVIGEIKAKGIKFESSICTKTLYNYIDRGIFANITNKDLPIKKKKKKGTYQKVKIAHKNLRGTSIEERPKHIEEREEYGHWEMDCVVGKRTGKGDVLLVLSERKTRQEKIFKIPNKTQEAVLNVLDMLEQKEENFEVKFKSITVDNGSEFLDFETLERSVIKPGEKRMRLYYAHPYSSWERGTNENSNKLIRRFIPKGTDIDTIGEEEIERIEHWMNNYPRRIFGYKTANDMLATLCA